MLASSSRYRLSSVCATGIRKVRGRTRAACGEYRGHDDLCRCSGSHDADLVLRTPPDCPWKCLTRSRVSKRARG